MGRKGFKDSVNWAQGNWQGVLVGPVLAVNMLWCLLFFFLLSYTLL